MDVSYVDRDHFHGSADEPSARALFKRAVRMVEIEVFSYCNRVCWFCPNRDGSRLDDNQYMDEGLYSAILRQLAEIDYDRLITYSRYNEPLADRIILRRIEEARNTLPRAHLHTNTNGDYVTLSYLEDLRAAGLRSLNIQIYLKNHEVYEHEKIRAKGEFILRKLGLPYTLTRDDPGEWIDYTLDLPGMAVRLYGRNFATNGTSRGDTVEIATDYVRTSPCLTPFWAAYIDFNGCMMPCCNLRSDIPQHEAAIVAKLDASSSLFQAFASSTLAEWRRSLMSYEEKQGLCRSCRFVTEADNAQAREQVAAARARA